MLKNAFNMREKNFIPFSAGEVRVVSNNPHWTGAIDEMKGVFDFKPHFGWAGAIEAGRGDALRGDESRQLATH